MEASGDGIVARAEWSGHYGKLVVIDHGSGVSTYYGHLSELKVAAGDAVVEGQVIGLAGSTGRSTAPHLHYEVRANGVPVDPFGSVLIDGGQVFSNGRAVTVSPVVLDAGCDLASDRASKAGRGRAATSRTHEARRPILVADDGSLTSY